MNYREDLVRLYGLPLSLSDLGERMVRYTNEVTFRYSGVKLLGLEWTLVYSDGRKRFYNKTWSGVIYTTYNVFYVEAAKCLENLGVEFYERTPSDFLAVKTPKDPIIYEWNGRVAVEEWPSILLANSLTGYDDNKKNQHKLVVTYKGE